MNKLAFRRPVVALAAAVAGALLAVASAYGQTFPLTLQVINLPAGTTCKQSMSGSTIVLDCGSGGTTPPGASAPTGCVATASATTLPAGGGAVNLAVANCSPATGLTYSWLKNGQATANASATWTDNLSGNTGTAATTTTYQVTVCNGSSCATFPQSPLTVAVAGIVDTSGTWNGTCDGFATTRKVSVNANALDRQMVNLGPNDALVVELTTGSHTTADTLGYPSSIGIADYGSQPSTRIARLSDKPCDFSTQAAPGANADSVPTVTMWYVVGSGNTYGGYYPLLKTNTKYYVNFKNVAGTSCFSDGNCNVFVEPNNFIK